MMPTVQLDFVVLHWLNTAASSSELLGALVIFLVEWLPYWFIVGLAAFGVLALLPRYRKHLRRNWEMVFVALAAGLVSRYGVAELIRAFYDRPRPFEVLSDLNLLVHHNGGGAFPSGHASFYFALAAVVGRYYPKTSLLFYAAAFSLTVSRVAAGIHWPSDIVGGAVIGIAVGLFAVSMFRHFYGGPRDPGR